MYADWSSGTYSVRVAEVWIGYVEVPPSVEAKIRSRRGVTGAQARAACEWPAVPLRVVWHEHPEHGRRLLVVARDDQGRLLRIILQPIDPSDGTWRLRTVLVGGKGA